MRDCPQLHPQPGLLIASSVPEIAFPLSHLKLPLLLGLSLNVTPSKELFRGLTVHTEVFHSLGTALALNLNRSMICEQSSPFLSTCKVCDYFN